MPFLHHATEATEMTHTPAVQWLRTLAHERAFGRPLGSDRLLQAGLDALLADVESPSLALLAGLGRNEESEALEPIVHLALHAADWNENWSPSLAEISDDVLRAARELLSTRSSTDPEL
ncbi:hypothetical protein ABZ721_31890 [Streptomyces sp. NPDC006733]|uniref:hypothetical protein n=1 Tax=Streptomyces sp. NPDC006733 TaxID=3155460 RepID=UPI0033D81D3B